MKVVVVGDIVVAPSLLEEAAKELATAWDKYSIK